MRGDTSGPNNEPIAIIGIGCRFPGAHGPDAFWELLKNGVDAIGTIPEERALLHAAATEPRSSRDRISSFGGFLPDIDAFDAGFFGFSGREAHVTDPQQRMLCEVAWEALEDGGQDPTRLRGRPVGVTVGSLPNDFHVLFLFRPAEWDIYAAVNTAPSSLSGRVAYALGFEGGALTVDTACSSSLLAVHLACSAIRSGEMEMAVAAGANLILHPSHSSPFVRSGMLAADGRCKAFDARGDGFVQSEGVAAVVLKPLARALAEGDPVYAVLRGSLANNDGATGQYKTPNLQGQTRLLQRVYERAGIDPNTVGYVEAHGTGTRAGDPVEAAALAAVLCRSRSSDHPLRIGSVKTNIGHTEGAAGIAGLIKVALALKHGALPPSLNFVTPNPDIPWADVPLEVQTTLADFPRQGRLGLAGVSAFGLSGVNCHAILEEAPPRSPRGASRSPAHARESIRPRLLVASGMTPEARRDNLIALRGALDDAALAVADVCGTVATRRAHFPYRAAVVGRAREELTEGLDALIEGEGAPNAAVTELPEPAPRVVFCFPGQGAQWHGMARGLIASDPAFAEELERCAAAIEREAGFSVHDELAAEPERSRLAEIDVLQPTLFAIQASLVAAWSARGVTPSAVVGHSMGEVAASYAAGILSLEDAVAVICRRSRLMRDLRGRGAMLLVELPRERAEAVLEGYAQRVSLAVHNGPSQVVLSGEVEAIDAIRERLEAEDVFCRPVKVDVASHSPQMDPIADRLMHALSDLRPGPGRVPLYSTVGARWDGNAPRFDAAYWWNNVREPVLFADAVEKLIGEGHQAFVELSPHPLLCQAIVQSGAAGATTVALPSMKRDEDELTVLSSSLAELYVRGAELDWIAISGEHELCRLPGYRWQHERFPIDYSQDLRAGGGLGRPMPDHPLLSSWWTNAERPTTHVFETEIDLARLSWLNDHRVQGEVVFPGAGYVEMALAAGKLVFGRTVRLADLSFGNALFLSDDAPARLQMVLDAASTDARVVIYALSKDNEAPTRLVEGTILAGEPSSGSGAGERLQRLVDDVEHEDDRWENAKAFYARLGAVGLEYGPAFQGVERALFAEGEGLTRLELSVAVREDLELYGAHPALLDAAMQSMCTAAGQGFDATFLPVGFGRVELLSSGAAPPRYVHVRMNATSDADLLVADIELFDEALRPVLALEGVRAARLERNALAELAGRFEHQTLWRPQPLEPLPDDLDESGGAWLVIDDDAGGAPSPAGEIARRLEERGARVYRLVRTPDRENADPRTETLTVSRPELDGPALRAALSRVREHGHEELRGVVYLAPNGSALTRDAAPTTIERATLDVCLPIVHLAKEAASLELRLGRLWVVTAGAVGPPPALPAVAQGAAWGLVRVLAVEHPELEPTGLDVTGGAERRSELVARELLARDAERQVAIRDDGRYVARLVRAEPPRLGADGSGAASAGDRSYRLVRLRNGSLALQASRGDRLAAGRVEVEVAAGAALPSDLNRMADPELHAGLAFSGTVRAVGPGVTSYDVGDAVIGCGDGLSRRVVVESETLWPKPATLRHEEATVAPLTYGVAAYALREAGATAGQRLYIDEPQSGVGRAASAIASKLGLHIASSDADVAIASSPAGARAAAAALRPFGKLVELLAAENGAGPFVRIAAEPGALVEHRPPSFTAALADVLAELGAGTLPPPTAPTAEAGELERIVELLSGGSESSPIAVRFGPTETPLSAGGPRLSPDGTYLVTGGLGGLGLSVAEKMVEEGAGALLLAGRSAPSERAERVVERLRERGARVDVVALDVTDEARLADVLGRCGSELPPLRGVVHAAGVLADATFLRLEADHFEEVFASKVAGTWSLHRQTERHDLDFFVVFSSAAAVVGSPGQANYAAANAFMDALMRERRASGLPSYSIQWGAWSEVGLAARPDRGGRLEALGLHSMSPSEGAALFMDVLSRAPGDVAAVSFDLAKWEAVFPAVRAHRFFDELRTGYGNASGGDSALLDELRALDDPRARHTRILEHLTELVAATLQVRAAAVDSSRSILALGMDSLLSIEIRNKLESVFHLQIPVALLLKGPSIRELADWIVSHLDDVTTEEAAEAPVALDPESLDDATFRWPNDLLLDDAIQPGSLPEEATPPGRFLLTGATGFVGSFVLHELLRAGAGEVHCLVRGRNREAAFMRLRESLETRGLWEDGLEDRMVVVLGDLSRRRLGLSSRRFEELADSVDEVVHLGAHVNFLLPYPSLRAPNVRGTEELLRLCGTGALKPLHFTSTYAVHLNALDEGLTAREDGLPRRVPAGGYCQTKYACEVLLDEARRRGFVVNVYRPGLAAWHSETGVFNERELVARFISSTIDLGMAPDISTYFHMTPVEQMASALVRLIRDPAARGGNFHVAAPRPWTWTDVVAGLRTAGHDVALVPPEQWYEVVAGAAGGEGEVAAFASSFLPTITDGEGMVLDRVQGVDSGLPEIDTRNLRERLGTDLAPSDLGTLNVFVERLRARGLLRDGSEVAASR